MSKRLELLSGYISEKDNKTKKDLQSVYIVAAKRTPIGSYMGKLSNFTGP